MIKIIPVLLMFFFFSSNALEGAVPSVFRPLPALTADALGVIVNDADPLSIKIGKYYQQQRKIPQENIIHIHFAPKQNVLDIAKFKSIKQKVDRLTLKKIQAYALTWTQPYKVGCMSITTAFAAGFDESFCAIGCKQTKQSSYYNIESSQPYKDFK